MKDAPKGDAHQHPVNDLTPASRQRFAHLTGTPILIVGQQWILADEMPDLGGVWDRLIDMNASSPTYEDTPDLQLAAVKLLEANYELSPSESVQLIRRVLPGDLVSAVERAMVGPEDEGVAYSDWARSALWINGIDPDLLPPRDRRIALGHLVCAGRAVPASKMVTSLIRSAKRDDVPAIVEG
jgi:hypothetical protein